MTDLAIANRHHGRRHFCTFRLDGRLYGLELSAVREVSTGLAITAVPHAPPEVRGLTNLRSRIYVVIDLRPILGLSIAGISKESRLVVLKDHVADNVGVLTDAGGDIVNLATSAVEAVPQAADTSAPDSKPTIVTEIGKLQQELLMVVDPHRMMDHVKRLIA